MSIRRFIKRSLKYIRPNPYYMLDQLYVPFDRKKVRRTRNIRLIPNEQNRRGGKHSYAEWAHVIGIFQTLMYLHLASKNDAAILDVGCGTGLLGVASEPFLGPHGEYVGIDVSKKDIDFCRTHYPSSTFKFIHFDVNNAVYSPAQTRKGIPWPLESNHFDLVTALSVWTHLNEMDASFYFAEVGRVLKAAGKAIVTCFLLDDVYEKSLSIRSQEKGRYHMTSQKLWIFDQPSYGSDAWFHPRQVRVPEQAIGITEAGLTRLMTQARVKLIAHYQGNWKEIPGVFFQDVLVFQKA